jgi:hypothetical protein
MSKVNLSKAELAALDLVIEHMKAEKAASGQEERVAAGLARARTETLGVIPVTATDIPTVLKVIAGGQGQRDQPPAGPVPPNVSLEQLIELRKAATSEED